MLATATTIKALLGLGTLMYPDTLRKSPTDGC